MNIPDYIAFPETTRHAERLAVIFNKDALTYTQLFAQSTNTAFMFKKSMNRGAIAAILAEPSVQYITTLLGGWMAGIIMMPLSTRLPLPTVQQRMQQVGCKSLITDNNDAHFPGIHTFNITSLNNAADPTNPIKLQTDFPATLIFTSGSTGNPKAVMHTLSNHLYNALGSNANIPVQQGDRWLLSLPMYHVGGIAPLFRCFLAGAAVVLPNSDEPLESLIKNKSITHISLVSTQLARMLTNPDAVSALQSLKAILLGGSAIPASLIDQAIAYNLPIHTSYGSTEMASQITTTQSCADAKELSTSGRLLPHRGLSFSDQGEIRVKGKTLFKGYFDQHGILGAVDQDGWFHTGDRGYLDEKGCLNVTGRLDNMFISGGENIQPEEIERCIEQIKGITQCIVVPIPDDEFGERPVAFLQYSDNPVKETIIRLHLEQDLEKFKHPVRFYPWPEQTGNGLKINRGLLKQLALKNS